MANGYYQVLMHPYVRYDFIHDPQVGGFIDLEKRGNGENQDALYDVAGGNGGFVARWGGCEIWASTNLTVVSGSPNKYRTYFFGAEALGAIDLAGRGPTRSEDQNKQKFSIHVENNIGPTVATPEGKIRAFCSYNTVYVAKTLDSNPFRYRRLDTGNTSMSATSSCSPRYGGGRQVHLVRGELLRENLSEAAVRGRTHHYAAISVAQRLRPH
jgi:hypothetical protein